MNRYLLILVVACLLSRKLVAETYRDEECPECEYDAVPIQVTKHAGYAYSAKTYKGSKSNSKTSKQSGNAPKTDSTDVMQDVDEDVLWDAYVSQLQKKKQTKAPKMPPTPQLDVLPPSDSNDDDGTLSEEEKRLWDIYISGKYPNKKKGESKPPKGSKMPKSVRPTSPPTTTTEDKTGVGKQPGDDILSSALFPEFQLIYSLADLPFSRELWMSFHESHRFLQSELEIEIYNITYSYLMNGTDSSSQLFLRQSAATVTDEVTSSITSTFQGMLVFDEYYSSISTDDLETLLVSLFDDDKSRYVSQLRNSDLDILQRTEDVTLSFTGKVSSTSTYDNVSWYQPQDETKGNMENSGGSADVVNETEGDENEDSALNVTVVKSSDNTALIAGALAGSATLLLFIYAYRRHGARDKEYEVAEYSHEHDRDLESKASEDDFEMSMMNSVEHWNGTKLSEIAIAGPKHNGFSYIEAVNSSYPNRNSMSKLASGATQEEFARSGMKVDIYGSRGIKKKRISKKRMNKVALLISRGTLSGNNGPTDLDPIDEVNSAVSSSSAKTPESWQNGSTEINNAPPLLPAMSVSSVPSDETPANDISNMNTDYKSLSKPISSPGISYHTPLAVPPYDSMDIEGLKGDRYYAPNDEIFSAETPLHMRCLSFSSGSDISDFSSAEQSEQSCVKDIAEAMNPSASDSSSDGCVKDMLASMNDCTDDKVNNPSNPEIPGNNTTCNLRKLVGEAAHADKSDVETCEVLPLVDSLDTESLCYSHPSNEDKYVSGKSKSGSSPPDLSYSDTSCDMSLIIVNSTDDA